MTPVREFPFVVSGQPRHCNPARQLSRRHPCEEKRRIAPLSKLWNQWATFLFPCPPGSLLRLRTIWVIANLAGEPMLGRAVFLFLVRGRNTGHCAGGSELTFESEKDGERRRKLNQASKADSPPPSHPASPRKKSAGTPEVGYALRSIYQTTIDEEIPPEMLDLLSKLG